MSIGGTCDSCHEPAVGVIYTTHGPGFLCREELRKVALSVVKDGDRITSFTRRVEASPGEFPCQCPCGCRRDDEETRLAPRLDPFPEYVLPEFRRLARRTDPKRLVGEFETNEWPVEDLADHTWWIALQAVRDALNAAMWVDIIEPETHAALLKPWRAFRAEVERQVVGA